MANRFDDAMLAVTAVALAGWVLEPAVHPVAWLLLVAGASHAVRLTRWAGLRAVADPLVFVLHVAYAWMPAGLLLLGGATLWPVLPVSSAMRALGAGAMAAMTLAVMTRATRGHTGRPLEADGAMVAIYVSSIWVRCCGLPRRCCRPTIC